MPLSPIFWIWACFFGVFSSLYWSLLSAFLSLVGNEGISRHNDRSGVDSSGDLRPLAAFFSPYSSSLDGLPCPIAVGPLPSEFLTLEPLLRVFAHFALEMQVPFFFFFSYRFSGELAFHIF